MKPFKIEMFDHKPMVSILGLRLEDLYIEDDMPKKKYRPPVTPDLCSLTADEVNEWLRTLPRPPMAWEADFADKG